MPSTPCSTTLSHSIALSQEYSFVSSSSRGACRNVILKPAFHAKKSYHLDVETRTLSTKISIRHTLVLTMGNVQIPVPSVFNFKYECEYILVRTIFSHRHHLPHILRLHHHPLHNRLPVCHHHRHSLNHILQKIQYHHKQRQHNCRWRQG